MGRSGKVTLISSEVAVAVSEFSGSRFPFRTPGGPFWSQSVGKASLFAPNSLTVSLICEPSVPTGYSHLERSGRADFRIFRSPVPFLQLTLISGEVTVPVSEFSGLRFPFRTPGSPFWIQSVGKASLFAPNSLTVSPICESSVPTGYYHLERSGRSDFGIFRSPVPIPNHRRAVLEPKCRKIAPFRPNLPNHESYLRTVSSYNLLSSLARWPCRFPNFPFLQVTLISREVTVPVSEFSGRRFPFRTPGGPFWSLSVGKASLFTPSSLTVSPICEPSVPTAYSHLERSGRAGFGIFRSPVPVPDPRQANLEPMCRRRVPFRPKLPNRVSYLGAVSSYSLLSSRAKWPCKFQNFPVAGSSSGPPVTLISSEVAVPVSYFSGSRFPFRTPGGPFGSQSVGKASLFAPNSLTVSLICEQSVPIGYSHHERSGRANFGIFRSPVPVPEPRRAILEPKCRRRVPFLPKLPNRVSYLRAVSSYSLLSSRAKWPCPFRNFPVAGSSSGPPAGRLGA
ncbi:hypothetical protein MRB53_013049 [Persea americana]|nr:hypothetical protein MRB53_013049 [Persea americana]